MEGHSEKRLGLAGLTAIVVGSMVGSGLFNISQTMAAGAALGAVAISWLVCGAGIGLLVWVFKLLSERRPDLEAGIYQYASEVAGPYVGFNVAWGYWLSAAVAIVAYAVMFNDTLGAFFPFFLDHGWPTLLLGLAIVWLTGGVVLMGVGGAARLNTAMTVLKALLVVFILVTLAIYAKAGAFKVDFWGVGLGSVMDQVRSDMMVSLWCFIGVEGAVMMSSRAKRRKDVGRAGFIGFGLSWLLFAMVSVLCFGVMGQAEQAGLPNPSIAYVLRESVGEWAYWFVIISVLVSLAGCWVAWTLVCAQTPFGAAHAGMMPGAFKRVNKRGVPHYALLVSCVFMTLFLLLVCISDSLYTASVELSGVMILPAYLFSAIYALKLLRRKGNSEAVAAPEVGGTRGGGSFASMASIGAAALAVVFSLWMFYAGGVALFFTSTLFYLPGTWWYLRARREATPGVRSLAGLLPRRDRLLVVCLCACAAVSVVLLATGHSPF